QVATERFDLLAGEESLADAARIIGRLLDLGSAAVREEPLLDRESERAIEQRELDADAGVGLAFRAAVCHVVVESIAELHGLRPLREVVEQVVDRAVHGADPTVAPAPL